MFNGSWFMAHGSWLMAQGGGPLKTLDLTFEQCPVKQNNAISILEMPFKYIYNKNDPRIAKKCCNNYR